MRRIKKLNNVYKQKKLLFKKIKSYIWVFCVSSILICTFTLLDSPSLPARDNTDLNSVITPEEMFKNQIELELTRYNDSIEYMKGALTNEVSNYIVNVHSNSTMNPRHIVEECLRTNFDIPLLLSQARLESQFGKRTGGTKSCFGVVSRRYKTCDESVTDYISIMQRYYVITRTPEQLIASGFSMEKSKKYKYASDPNYSKTISKLRTNIIKSTDIVPIYNSIQIMENQRDSLLIKLEKLNRDMVLD